MPTALWSVGRPARAASSSAPAARTARSRAWLRAAAAAHAPSACRSSSSRPTPPRSRARRIGKDGEPELLLFDDVGGYGWNVPKSDWLNVGCGTLDADRVRDAWRATHDHLRAAGHLPDEAEPELAHVKGHSYYLFDPVHLGTPRASTPTDAAARSWSAMRSGSPIRSPPRASCRPRSRGACARRGDPRGRAGRATPIACAAIRCSPTTAASTA